MQIKIKLSKIYYDSLVTVLYSFVEGRMLFLCNHLAENQTIKLRDFGGKGILKFKNYLDKVCGIDFLPIAKEWESLEGINKIRNHIVHSPDGNINKSNQQLTGFLRSLDKNIVHENKDGFVFYLTTAIINDFARTAHQIIDHLYMENVDLSKELIK
ncbi:MAG: hypothetical protein WDM90_01050 [Ferruginibacter sp.]